MALGSSGAHSSSKSERTSPSSSDTKPKGHKRGLGEVIDFCTKTIVMIVGLPIRIAASIVSQFVANGGAGRALVGGILFIGGSMVSADSTWQLIFQGLPLFPYFEPLWKPLNVPFVLFNPFFYLAFLISVGVQVIEAHALRGKNPDSARRELQDHMAYDLESKPNGKIDLVGHLWADYKSAGTRDRSASGLVVLFIWGFDIVTTFAARNPFQYTDPFMILGCFTYNIITMMAGEIGFAIWRLTKD